MIFLFIFYYKTLTRTSTYFCLKNAQLICTGIQCVMMCGKCKKRRVLDQLWIIVRRCMQIEVKRDAREPQRG